MDGSKGPAAEWELQFLKTVLEPALGDGLRLQLGVDLCRARVVPADGHSYQLLFVVCGLLDEVERRAVAAGSIDAPYLEAIPLDQDLFVESQDGVGRVTGLKVKVGKQHAG